MHLKIEGGFFAMQGNARKLREDARFYSFLQITQPVSPSPQPPEWQLLVAK
jgi:hypothetical protein